MSAAEQIHHSRNLIVRGDDGEDAVGQFAEAQLGWPMRHRDPEDRDAWFPYTVTWYAGPAIELHYQEDLLSDVAYVHITGTDPDVVRVTAEMAESGLNTLRLPELLRAAAESTSPEDTAYAVMQAGLGSPRDFNEAFFTLLTTAMKSDSRMVREASIWAITYVPWGAYLEPLRQMVEDEADEALRGTARNLFVEFRENPDAVIR
jgi:hypothetical protein